MKYLQSSPAGRKGEKDLEEEVLKGLEETSDLFTLLLWALWVVGGLLAPKRGLIVK